MPIIVTCPSCEQKLRGSEGVAGRKLKCPKCGKAITVPALSKALTPSQGKAANPKHSALANANVEDLAAAFLSEGEEESAKSPFKYGPNTAPARQSRFEAFPRNILDEDSVNSAILPLEKREISVVSNRTENGDNFDDQPRGQLVSVPPVGVDVSPEPTNFHDEDASFYSHGRKPLKAPLPSPFDNIAAGRAQSADSNLLSCPECGKQVSRRASQCPECGCPLQTVENSASTHSHLQKTTHAPYSFFKRKLILFSLVGVVFVLLLSTVPAYYFFFPSPKRSFEQLVKRIEPKLTSYQDKGTMERFNSNGPLSYNVIETTSLVSPYLGTLRFQTTLFVPISSENHSAEVCLTREHMVTYALQNNKWVPTRWTSIIIDISGKDDIAGSLIRHLQKEEGKVSEVSFDGNSKLTSILRGE